MEEEENQAFIGSNDISISQRKQPSLFFSVRFLTSFLVFLGVATQYMQKIDMSIGIVCMVNHTAESTFKHRKEIITHSDIIPNDTCLFKSTNETHDHSIDGPFTWSKETQGMILSSYFYGYILTQIPSGWLSFKIGGRKVLGFSMLFGSLLTCLVSVTARMSYWALIICRFLTGIVHGAVWPATSALFVFWSPPLEKSRLIGLGSSGSWVGNVVALRIGSYLCVYGFDGGWSSIFYVFGLIGVCWFGLFILLTSDKPSTHRFIKKDEREYLNEKIIINTPPEGTPWLLMFTSESCWAIFATHFSANWANYLFLTQLPSYMNDILRFDIKSNGFFSTLPYIACWLVTFLSSLTSDYLISNRIMSIKNTRKWFNSIGLLLFASGNVGMIFTTCENPYLAVAFLTMSFSFLGFLQGAGYSININEVGGIYSGILFGISNCIATLPGIIAPYIVGLIASHKLQSEWQIVFLISICVYIFGAVMSLLFTDSKPFYKYDINGDFERVIESDSSHDD